MNETRTHVPRRGFLRLAGACGLGLLAGRLVDARALQLASGRIMTVLGPVAPGEFGSALVHEHVLVDFIGADRISRDRYDAQVAFEVILPHLRHAKELGCRGFVECTPAYLGRDPRLVERLARASGLHILTNTGYYGAAKDQYVPRHAYEETAAQLADRWTREWTDGIEDTGIRPGFIKTGVDAGPLSAIDRKLVEAAARTHQRTGLTIASHTGDTKAAADQLDVLAREGVHASAFIWVHAQNDWRLEPRVEAARQGAWIEIDNVSDASLADNVARVEALRQAGVLHRVLVSHDAGWYRPGERGGGSFRPFDVVHTRFVEALRRQGWTDADVAQVLVANPADAFTVRVRSAART